MGESIAVILGSAFGAPPAGFARRVVATPHGDAEIWESPDRPGAYALFRHGMPHRWLPNQIPYRAHAAALQALDVGALLVTSSVGVLNPAVPLLEPLLVGDLVWLDNRLPDGSACTMWPEPAPGQGHLVVESGLFAPALAAQIRTLAASRGLPLARDPVTFWYAPGPRTKTAAENRVLAGLGLDVNSMTLAPEVVLANELGIPCAGLVVGHKPSGPGMGEAGVRQSLDDAREAARRLVLAFLAEGAAVPFPNHVYRYG